MIIKAWQAASRKTRSFAAPPSLRYWDNQSPGKSNSFGTNISGPELRGLFTIHSMSSFFT
jgi:hypothetical protein